MNNREMVKQNVGLDSLYKCMIREYVLRDNIHFKGKYCK